MNEKDLLKVALAQIAPVWLDRENTLKKVEAYISKAANEHADLVVFGEALVPGYPFWLEKTGGSIFNSPLQKEIHSIYLDQAICIEKDDLSNICKLAREKEIAVFLGVIERPMDRGGMSLYCSIIYIDKKGIIQSVHRKLTPTYEERLAWSPGDGNGLVTHKLESFVVGGLNCWENWMPLARAALYAQGETLHVSIWPGNKRNTEDLIPVLAKESRSYVIGVCGLFRKEDIPDNFPASDEMKSNSKEEFIANGGSCLAAPDGSWIIEPFVDKEDLIYAVIDNKKVREERQNFDPSGHYSRPDITKLYVNRERQSILSLDK